MKNIQRYALGVLSILVVVLGATSISLYSRLRGMRPRALTQEERNEAVAVAAADAAKAAESAPMAITSMEFIDEDVIKVTFGPHDDNDYWDYDVMLQPPASAAVEVSPQVANLSVDAWRYGNRALIKGNFKPETTYAVTIGAGWKFTGRSTLAMPYTKELKAPVRNPQFEFVADRTYFPARREGLLLPFRARGISRLDVKVFRALDYNVSQYGIERHFCENYPERYEVEQFGGRLKEFAKGSIPVDVPANEISNRMLPVSSILTNATPGIYRLSVDAVKFSGDPSKPWPGGDKLIHREVRFVLTDLSIQFSKDTGGGEYCYAAVTSIASGGAVTNADVSVYDIDRHLVASGKTGPDGIVKMKLDMPGSKNVFGVLARTESDMAFIDAVGRTQGYWWDEDDGNKNETVKENSSSLDPGAVRMLVFSERDICRPGESFEAAVFVRSSPKSGLKPLAAAPVEMKFIDASGNLVESRKLVTDAYGFARTTWTVPEDGSLGVWRAQCVVGSTSEDYSVIVASFVPDRFSVGLEASETSVIGLERPVAFTAKADYYFGEPLADGEAKLTAVARAADPQRHWKGWTVGTENWGEQRNFTSRGTVSNGLFVVNYPGLSANQVAKSFVPVSLVATVDVQEPGGRNVSSSTHVTFFPTPWYVGVRKCDVTPGAAFSCELALLPAVAGAAGTNEADRAVEVKLFREVWKRRFVERPNGGADIEWESAWVENKAAATTIPIPAGASLATWMKRLDFASGTMEGGRHRLDAFVGGEMATSFEFWHWEGEVSDRAMNADALVLVPTAEKFVPGEAAGFKFDSPFNGTAFVTAGACGIDTFFSHAVTQGENVVSFPLPAGLDVGAYYVALTLATDPAKGESRRLNGTARLKVDCSRERRLDIDLALPEKAEPGEEIAFTVSLKDGAGNPASGLVRIGAIDKGVAALTRFKAPDAFGHFFANDYGRRFVLFDYFDSLYPLVKLNPDGSFGGDGGALTFGLKALSGNRRDGTLKMKETARFALPPVLVPTSGVAVVKAKMPDHVGALHVTAVAGSERAAGSADDTIVLRNKISAFASAPRFCASGDAFAFTATVFNHDAPDGAYTLVVELPEGLSGEGAEGGKVVRTGSLKRGESKVETFRAAAAADARGRREIPVSLELGGLAFKDVVSVDIRPVNPVVAVTEYFAVTNGVLEIAPAAADWTGPAASSLEISGSPAFAVGESLSWLADYPYGCLEQTTACAFPFLVADDLAKLGIVTDDQKGVAAVKVKKAYANILTMSVGDGSFAMWPGVVDTWKYGTLFADHFIFEAERMGLVKISDPMRAMMAAWLRMVASDASPANRDNAAYAAYILGVSGDRHFVIPARNVVSGRDTDFAAFVAAAALVRFGYASEGMAPFSKALEARAWNAGGEWDKVKNLGMALYLASKTGIRDVTALAPIATALNGMVRGDGSAWGTTRDNAWAALGLASYAARLDAGKSFGKAEIGDRAIDFEVTKKSRVLARDPADGVKVLAEGPVFVRSTTVGVPVKMPARSEPVRIERTYLDSDGKPVSTVRRGDIVTVVVKVASPSAVDNLVVVDMTPGGFEIEDLSLATRAAAGAFMPTDCEFAPCLEEIRDDRWIGFAKVEGRDVSKKDDGEVVYYHLRAVVPGTYAVPAASAEDMYNPDLRGSFSPGGTLTIE